MSNSSQIDQGDIFTDRFPVIESDIIRCRIKFWIEYTYFNRREFILKRGIQFPTWYTNTYIRPTRRQKGKGEISMNGFLKNNAFELMLNYIWDVVAIVV